MSIRVIITRTIVLLAIVSSAMAYRYGRGPRTKCTNAPGESSCRMTDCHAQYELNSGGGTLTLKGVPVAYQPGRRYVLTVSLAQTGQKRWGFQITALTATNQPAGELSLVQDSLTQIKTATFPDSSVRQYVEHTAEGSFRGRLDGPVQWDLAWTAPKQPAGDIIFYTAANAANFNKKPWGDYIYTRADTSLSLTSID
ncbi:MAG: choice-of-anchor V domain-containing protein [Candidatus Neomarinimicrobiota bacterium]